MRHHRQDHTALMSRADNTHSQARNRLRRPPEQGKLCTQGIGCTLKLNVFREVPVTQVDEVRAA